MDWNFFAKCMTGTKKNKLTIFIGNPRSFTTTVVRVWAAREDGTLIMNEPGVYAYNRECSPPPLCAMEGRRPRRVVRDSPRFY